MHADRITASADMHYSMAACSAPPIRETLSSIFVEFCVSAPQVSVS
jgi:hypothetical protein